LEGILRKSSNVDIEEEAAELIELSETKFREAKKKENELLRIRKRPRNNVGKKASSYNDSTA
jgi:hypothetical protein